MAVFRALQTIFEFFGFHLVGLRELGKLRAKTNAHSDLKIASEFVSRFPRGSLPDYLLKSTSQLYQDIFVLSELDFKKGGYFVEFGATDGKTLSNSFLLEKEFGWTGIVADPARRWHKALHENRTAFVDIRCVWSATGASVIFNETEVGEFSTIDSFSSSDRHKARREKGRRYEVETVSLLDLLQYYSAPQIIDYLSIDTEGSELEILKAFDFRQYSFRVISVEHNFTENRERIRILLEENGYVRVHEWLSGWDDWYINEGLQRELSLSNGPQK